MKPTRLALFLTVLLALFLTACSGAHRSEIVPPQAVVSPRLDGLQQDAQNLEVAVGSDGSHHLIYEEKVGSASRLVYAYQKFAEAPRLLVIPPEWGAESYMNPDIAVTSDGTVHITWQMLTGFFSGTYNCYASFQPTETTPPTCTNLDLPADGFAFESEPPTLVAKGDAAYAVYTVISRSADPYHQLKLKVLAPAGYELLAGQEGLLAGPSAALSDPLVIQEHQRVSYPVQFHHPALAIDSDGILHIVFAYTPLSGTANDRAYYARLNPTGGGAIDELVTLASNYRFEGPAIAVQPNPSGADQVAYLFNINPRAAGAGDSLFAFYTHPADAAVIPSATLPLPPGFVVTGSPALVMEGGTPVAYFAGSSTAGANEIYGGAVNAAPGSFMVLSGTPVTDCPPKAVRAEEPDPESPGSSLYSPVAIWRECAVVTVRDLYVYDITSPDAFWRVRKAAGQGDANDQEDYDLAAHGSSVFAAWIDAASESDPSLVPWISTNGYRVSVPVVLK